MALVDPLTRISEHFIFADFLGNHSVYAKGMANGLADNDPYFSTKWRNGQTLCSKILEPLLGAFGPVTISYGFISPEMSQRIVTYQDPAKPSHHMWSLGAAADVCVHNWVEGCDGADVTANSPAALAGIMLNDDGASYPLSRLITYSESPYICMAASHEEVRRFDPRLAIYENRYTGKPKVKPTFLRYNAPRARAGFVREIQDTFVLDELGWRGAGYPTHHGGGVQQYQHRRVSKYTMVSDWLFDLQTIANGQRNNPRLNDPNILDAFAAAGIVYDALIDGLGLKRISIVRGHAGGRLEPGDLGDWSQPTIGFEAVLPSSFHDYDHIVRLKEALPFDFSYDVEMVDNTLISIFQFEVDDVLNNAP